MLAHEIGPLQIEVIAKRHAGVLETKAAATLQFRHDLRDKIVEHPRQRDGHHVESVATITVEALLAGQNHSNYWYCIDSIQQRGGGMVGNVGIALRICGGLVAAIGLVLIGGGAWLAFLHGPLGDIVLGGALAVSGGLLCLGSSRGARLYFLSSILACAWGVWEVGLDGWALLPRTALLLVILAMVGVLWPRPSGEGRAVAGWWALGAAVLGLGLLAYLTLRDGNAGARLAGTSARVLDSSPSSDDWPSYGRTLAATRFEPATQITPANVGRLEVAWTYRSGDLASAGAIQESEATPLKIDRTLYFCTPHNEVIAVDAASGKERWRFDPHIDRRKLIMAVCRGVVFYRCRIPCPRMRTAIARSESSRAHLIFVFSKSMPERACRARGSATMARWICGWASDRWLPIS